MFWIKLFSEPAHEQVPAGQEPAEVQPSPSQRMLPPNFIEPVKSVEAVDGQELRMPCKVTGKPMPQVSWYHNGKNIDQDEEYVVTYNPDTGDISLLIVEVFPEDEGEYVCVAHNPAGDAVTRATLVVMETEEILRQPMEEETDVKVAPEAPETKVVAVPAACLPEAAEIEEDEVRPDVIERPKVVPLHEEKAPSPTFEFETEYIPVQVQEQPTTEVEEQVVAPTKLVKPAPKLGPDEVKEEQVQPDVIERPKVVPLEETKPELPSFDFEIEEYYPPDAEEREEMPPQVEEQVVQPEKIVKPAPEIRAAEVKEAEVKPAVIERPKVVPLEETKAELPEMEFEIEDYAPTQEEDKEQPPVVEEQVVQPAKIVRPTVTSEVTEAEVKPDVIERPKVVPLEETKAELPEMEFEIEDYAPTQEEQQEQMPPEVEEQVVQPAKIVRPAVTSEVKEDEVKPDVIERPKVVPLEETKAELPPMEFEIEDYAPVEAEEKEQLPPTVEEQVVEPEKLVRPAPRFEPAEAKESEVKADVIERPKVVALEETKPELPPMEIEVDFEMKETPEVEEELPEEIVEEVLESDLKPRKIDRPKTKPLTEEKPELLEMDMPVEVIEKEAEQPEEMGPEAEEEVLEQAVKITKIDKPKPKPLVEEKAPVELDFDIPVQEQPEEKPETGPEITEEALVPNLIKKKVDIPDLKPKDEDVGKKKARDDEERPPKKEEICVPEQFEPVEGIESPEEIPPEFVELMQPQIVCDGDTVVLKSKVVGVPTPSITWYRESAEITPSTDFQTGFDAATGECTLLIPEVFPEDAGEYACRAVNPFGESVTTANLLVEGKNYFYYCTWNGQNSMVNHSGDMLCCINKTPGLEVIKLEFILRLKIKRNDWLLVDTCPQAANHCPLF